MEAVHEASDALLAAEDYAEAYLARIVLVDTISELFQWATEKRPAIEPPV